MNNNKLTSIILICIIGVITTLSAITKMHNEHFTIGGYKYRTKFWSSLFFIILALLSFSSMGLLLTDNDNDNGT